MELGICTRYTRHEATYAAVRLASGAAELGNDASLFAITDHPAEIDRRWDRTVTQNRSLVFTKWATPHKHILWTTLPTMGQVLWAKRQQKRTSALILWHELDQEDRPLLAELDWLICPHLACYELLQSWGLRNCICLPWDCGLPLHVKPCDYSIEQPKLLLPLWDGNARRTEMTIVEIVRLVLQRHPTALVTVACNSSSMRSCALLRLAKLAASFKGRLQIQRQVRPADRFRLFQAHDLTLWPTHFESTCMTALQSIEMGTPVMGFSFTPTNEVLTPQNSIAIPCSEEFNDVGLPRAIPDYECFDETLHQVLCDPGYLRQLQGTTLLGAQQRRDAFGTALSRLML